MGPHRHADGPALEPDGGWQSVNTVFTNAKAGMGGVDKKRVQRIVHEMSKDSPHFANERRKEVWCTRCRAKVRARIERLKAQHAKLRPSDLALATAAADARLRQLESTRDLSRVILHVDMDAFYAACEERDDPSLASKPVAVGGIGMVCTANYVARTFGVRAAMPGFIARRLCPELLFVKPDFRKYAASAELARAVFASVDPAYVSHGLDEACLDATKYCESMGLTPEEVAAEVRRRVHEATRLTCSVGIASNPMLAKVCSDLNKPDGQYWLPNSRDAILRFLASLPVRKVPGVGKVTEQMLGAFGIQVVEDLHTHRGLLHALFSPISFDFFMHASLGLHAVDGDPRPEHGRKGISCERTFAAISTRAAIEAKAAQIAAALAADMKREGLAGKCVTLKLKAVTFEVRTRAVTLAKAVSSKEDLLAVALRLLAPELPISIRLLGLRVSAFDSPPPPSQLTLSQFVCCSDTPAPGRSDACSVASAQTCSSGSAVKHEELQCEAAVPDLLDCSEDEPYAAAGAASSRPRVLDACSRQARAFMGVVGGDHAGTTFWDAAGVAGDGPSTRATNQPAALDCPRPAFARPPPSGGDCGSALTAHRANQGSVESAARLGGTWVQISPLTLPEGARGAGERAAACTRGAEPSAGGLRPDSGPDGVGAPDARAAESSLSHRQAGPAVPKTDPSTAASPLESEPSLRGALLAELSAWGDADERSAATAAAAACSGCNGGASPCAAHERDLAACNRVQQAGSPEAGIAVGHKCQSWFWRHRASAVEEPPALPERPFPLKSDGAAGSGDVCEALRHAGQDAPSQALGVADFERSRDEAGPETGGLACVSDGGHSAPSCRRCEECSALIPPQHWQEHQDWHVALKVNLHINGTGAVSLAGPPSHGCSGQKFRGGADASGVPRRGGGRDKDASASAAKRRKSVDVPKALSLERFGFGKV